MKEFELYIGLLAGICTAMSLLPQLIKIIRDKKANAISYSMLGILMFGLICWVVYGVIKNDFPLIITNSVSILLNGLIVFFTARYKT